MRFLILKNQKQYNMTTRTHINIDMLSEWSYHFGFDYCTEMPNRSTCWINAMFVSQYCDGNAGGLQRGVCRNQS